MDNITPNEHPILADAFQYFKKNKELNVSLYLTNIKLHEQKADKIKQYSVNDIVGCSLGKGKDSNDFKSYLTIYIYPKKNKKRQREVVILEFAKFQSYEANLEALRKWSLVLNKILSKDPVLTDSNLIVHKPFLVFVNPVSGAGKAKNIFYERILPIFSEANTPHELFLTKYQNHAREQIAVLSFSDYRGIIVVSGDGLVFEVINGIMERPDFIDAIKIPIGQIPGGSGNALACSIAYMCNEPFRNMSLENAAMHMSILAVKHDVMPMDLTLVEVYQTNERLQNPITSQRMYGFLCIEWAIIADVDYESEKYRYLGGLRFTIGAVKRILDLRIYRGRISFLPADNCKDYIPKDPNIKVMHNRHSLGQINTTTGTHQTRGSSPPSFVIHNGKPIIAPKYLVPFDKPVPDDWLTIEENFILLLVAQMPLIATDFMCWPDCELNNGELLLIYIKEGCSKVNMLKILTSTENGEYLQNPYVEYVRIKAFRLEPLDTNGNIMVDGEKVPYGPIQGEVLPSIANCVSKHSPRSA